MQWSRWSDKVIFVTSIFLALMRLRISLLVEASSAPTEAVVSAASLSSASSPELQLSSSSSPELQPDAPDALGLRMKEPDRGSKNWNISLLVGVDRSLLQGPARRVLTGEGDSQTSPAAELAHLLSQAVQIHLPDCQKVVLYKYSSNATRTGGGDDQVESQFNQLVAALVNQFGRDWEDIWLWELDAFLARTSPTYSVNTKPHRSTQGEYCVAFIVLADLESVGEAFTNIRKGSWFEGSTKYTLAFSGDLVTANQVISHRLLRESSNLVVVSRVLQDSLGPLERRSLARGSPVRGSPVRGSPARGSLARGSSEPRVYQMVQVCPYCAAGSPQVRVVAEWSPTSGFYSDDPLFPDLFQNFQGHQFRVVTLVYEPFSCYHKEGSRIMPADNCIDNNMLREISAVLNFTYVFVEPSDGQWGHRLQNGSYTGVIGAVERMEADFSLNVAITQDREEKVDCTIGYHVEPITFATSKPRLLNQALALLRPFTHEVWLAFAATLVLAGPFYYMVCRLSSRGDATLAPPSVIRACFYVFGACFNQSVKWVSDPGARIFMMTYVLTMFVTVTVYVAMLTATLTLPALSPTLNFLQELIESDFTWGIQDLGAADYQLLKTSEVPLYRQVYRGLKPCPALDACITKARDTKYAFITWRTYLEDRIAVRFTSATGERQLHVATGNIFPVELGWATNPGCPYRHHFNHIIRSLLESGLVAKGVFFLLVMGHSLSCIAFVSEVTLSNTSSP
ncbi:glutamate receptor ionotropic, delta-1 isoform X2 [Procambarus clarkii]|uniref:glutamate receptor ionotropic, delta-1 isoform X2 n=1 Tax=Procambarus clarkii TaxID=6728 RepID=UPI001E674C97|nr:ionotropic receptor 93a-like isoform X2 [Procambarus clarkii]